MNTYISWVDFARATSGLEYSTIIGNTGYINGTNAVGTTSLAIQPNTIVQINKYDIITIFDGINSETVKATGITSIGSSTIAITPTTFAHSDGVPYCTDGILGSLADQIVKASQWLETLCRQSLFSTTYTSELLGMPTMRAAIDTHYVLHFRPRHWPVQSISNISITTIPGDSIQYDPAQIFIDSDKQICTMPNMQALPSVGSGQAPYPIWNVMNYFRTAQLSINYTSGFTTIPADVLEAAVLLTSDILSKRNNPTGAPEIRSGSRMEVAMIRGELTGDSLLFKRAKRILDNYTMESF